VQPSRHPSSCRFCAPLAVQRRLLSLCSMRVLPSFLSELAEPRSCGLVPLALLDQSASSSLPQSSAMACVSSGGPEAGRKRVQPVVLLSAHHQRVRSCCSVHALFVACLRMLQAVCASLALVCLGCLLPPSLHTNPLGSFESCVYLLCRSRRNQRHSAIGLCALLHVPLSGYPTALREQFPLVSHLIAVPFSESRAWFFLRSRV
jgi:hypothetical protein